MNTIYQNPISEYLKTVEAAAYLGLSRQFLEIARHRGEGPTYVKVGRAVRYRRMALDQFMKNNEKQSSTTTTSKMEAVS